MNQRASSPGPVCSDVDFAGFSEIEAQREYPEVCREQLKRILDSPWFSPSRRLSDFLLFAGQAAIEGRTEIDQYEVAEQVLHRGPEFNPLDDASVRKLATQTRQKLVDYYRLQGAEDPVLVSLPKRSYVLRFRLRSASMASEKPELQWPDPSPESNDSRRSIPDSSSVSTSPETEPSIVDPARSPQEESTPLPTVGGDAEHAREVIHSRTTMTGNWRFWAAIATILIIVVGIVVAGWFGPSPRSLGRTNVDAHRNEGVLRIQSHAGDLRGGGSDVASDGIAYGLPLHPDGDATVRLEFLAQHATQQAGLMLVNDLDHFVRLGVHFKSRSMLEFGSESGGNYDNAGSQFEYDPLGQTGHPLWLSLRKTGDLYQSFLSRDGFHWEAYGKPQSIPQPFGPPTASVYAFNGRTAIPSSEARFQFLGVGLRFHHRQEGALEPDELPGWVLRNRCEDPEAVRVEDHALQVEFPANRLCGVELLHHLDQPEAGPWSITIHLDFQPLNGSSAGIFLWGENSRLRLVRRDLNGASIMMEQKADRDTRLPDFPGNPPLYLRLRSDGVTVTGSFSRDRVNFITLPVSIPAKELGALKTYGAGTALPHWLEPGARPPARFFSIERDVVEPAPIPKHAMGRNERVPDPSLEAPR